MARDSRLMAKGSMQKDSMPKGSMPKGSMPKFLGYNTRGSMLMPKGKTTMKPGKK